MPVVSLRLSDLQTLVGHPLEVAILEERLALLGSSVERVEGDLMDVEFFPNRPDHYSVEGVARTLRAFLGFKPGLTTYRLQPSAVEFHVDPSVADVRPFVVGGIVRGLRLADETLRSLIDLQEKLHTTLGRRRAKVAIGLHDVDRVRPPFTYRAVAPNEVHFVPLGMDREMDLEEILRGHPKGMEFAPILQGNPRYPIIQDKDGGVLSFPPIINGVLTQLTEATRNLFVDVTGTSEEAVGMTLNILMTAMSERGGRLASVLMVRPEGTAHTPDLRPRAAALDLGLARSLLGIEVNAGEAAGLMRKMGFGATAEGRRVMLRVPAYRTDILHQVDFVEDLGIAYGIERFKAIQPNAQTVGATEHLNDMRVQARQMMIGYGFQEVITLELIPKTTPFQPLEPAATILNPITDEAALVRSSLLPSLLEILRLNKPRDLPQRIFEVAEVCVGGRNRLLLGAALMDSRAGFTNIKSLAEGMARDMGMKLDVEPRADPNFIPGRCANWLHMGRAIGHFGEFGPRLVTEYELAYPVVALELELVTLERTGSNQALEANKA